MQASTAREATPDVLAAELLLLWRHLLRGSTKDLYALLAELDLSMTLMKALHLLSDYHREMSVKELAEALSMSLPNASRTVDALLQRGLVERREDAQDRRMRRIGVTAAGHEAVHRIDTARLQNLETWAGALTPEHRETLLAALLQLPEDVRT